jgi:transposase
MVPTLLITTRTEKGTMSPRILASKKTLRKIQEKVHYALTIGDVRLYKKSKGILMILSGAKYALICSELNVAGDTLRRWRNEFLARGLNSLTFKTSPGRPQKLTKSQIQELFDAIKKGPEACGYISACWRTPLIQDLIQERFGVLFSAKYLAEFLKNIGLTFQKAKFASGHLDEEKRTEWLSNTWPQIVKFANKKDAHILFGDEASFPQWGSLSYTWAPSGEQPIVKTSGQRKGYKVFGFISYFTGAFYHKATEEKLTSETYAEFIKEVLGKTRKHLIIIQDGARYHTSKAMKAFFEEHQERISVFQMPSYSPDFNPIEMLWKKIKQHGVHLKYFPKFEDLKNTVDEMLLDFGNACEEVLSLFGLYQGLEFMK